MTARAQTGNGGAGGAGGRRHGGPAPAGLAVPCASRCGAQIRVYRTVDGTRVTVDSVPDPAGDVVIAEGQAYPLDPAGRYQGKTPKAGALRHGLHRCPVDAAIAANWKLADASGTTGPCARCHLPTTRYGPNGGPICPNCRNPATSGQRERSVSPI